MAWLVCDERVLASMEVASTRAARRDGLAGRDEVEGALLLQRTRWVHTIGVRFPIDVAFLGEPDPLTPLGAKGVGEIGLVGIAAAIANAVYHATGKRIRELPITLEKLLD